MKPILVDNCEHYSGQTHSCTKCGRGLPDVCLDFENMKKAAEAYEISRSQENQKSSHSSKGTSDELRSLRMEKEQTPQAKEESVLSETKSTRHNGTPRPSDDGDDNPVAAVDTAAVTKPRGRPKKVTA